MCFLTYKREGKAARWESDTPMHEIARCDNPQRGSRPGKRHLHVNPLTRLTAFISDLPKKPAFNISVVEEHHIRPVADRDIHLGRPEGVFHTGPGRVEAVHNRLAVDHSHPAEEVRHIRRRDSHLVGVVHHIRPVEGVRRSLLEVVHNHLAGEGRRSRLVEEVLSHCSSRLWSRSLRRCYRAEV